MTVMFATFLQTIASFTSVVTPALHLHGGVGHISVGPLACGPGSPELSKSYMDMASKLFTFTFYIYIRGKVVPQAEPDRP